MIIMKLPHTVMPPSFEARLIASSTTLSQGVGITEIEIDVLVERMNQYMVTSLLLQSWIDGELEAVGLRDGEIIFIGSNNIDDETKRRMDIIQATALDYLIELGRK